MKFTKEQREMAKDRRMPLFHVGLDFRYVYPSKWQYEIDGPLPQKCANELQKMIERWEKEGLV